MSSAQGWEAGGHVRGTVATLPLIPAVVDTVSPVPVVAAGGIAETDGASPQLWHSARRGLDRQRFLASKGSGDSSALS